MASSPTTTVGGGKNHQHLICGVCQEVFRSPRLLPCVHSFCLYCVEGLVRQHKQSFPCPQCRKSIPVPPDGALGFPRNIYIPDDDLELARNETRVIMCPAPNHSSEPLVFFCKKCDQAICIRCKLTKHENHETEDIPDAAARCEDRLKSYQFRFDGTLLFLGVKSAEANENLKAAKMKGSAVKEQVQEQHDLLVARVDKWRDEILQKIDELNQSSEKQLSEDLRETQQSRDEVLQLRQCVHQAMDEKAPDAEKVCVDKEMRQGPGTWGGQRKFKSRVPDSTVRPGLHCDQSSISDDDIKSYLGFPVLLTMPSVTASEAIVPVYRCGQDGAPRTVHAVDYTDKAKIEISYGGWSHADRKRIAVDENGVPQLVIRRRGCRLLKCDMHLFDRCASDALRSKSASSKEEKELFIVEQPTLVWKHSSIRGSRGTVFSVRRLSTLTAIDVNKDGQLFAVVEQTKAELTKKPSHVVRLFRRPQRGPLTTYTPTDFTNFSPADVCFWSDDGVEKLLVADPQNDSVHVVKIEGDTCRFERYLAAGDGHLVRPTALDVDNQGRVWIGCGNGWVLRCEKRHEGCPADKHDDGTESASGRQGLLLVENSSHSTDVVSLVSEN